MNEPGWARRVPEGWLLRLHVQPGAKLTAVAGLHGDALKMKVNAPPLEGRANAALEAWLAKALGVPKRDVEVLRGESSRDKQVLVRAPGADPGVLLKTSIKTAT